MKIAVRIFIFVFFIFLSTPTIVSLIEKATDTSCFYSMTEEEVSHKEIKSEYKFDSETILFFYQPQISNLIHSENLSKHDNISSSIFIPPPDLI
jgi:hypothetical protein